MKEMMRMVMMIDWPAVFVEGLLRFDKLSHHLISCFT